MVATVEETAPIVSTIDELVQLSAVLVGDELGALTDDEKVLVKEAPCAVSDEVVALARELIQQGEDPLGETYCQLVTPQERRPLGQTYTPRGIVMSMVSWAADQGVPSRIVDPGAGSGRYLLAAGRRFPNAHLLGSDIDPMATLMLRASIVAAGYGDRASVNLGDYRTLAIAPIDEPTLYIGNPPYVRHHQIGPEWKRWLLETARKHGIVASGLAGLHAHFFLATAEHANPGDYGTFITSAEWLDVNYGRLIRQLLLDGLGGHSVHVLDPQAAPFSDATTTGAITCFRIGSKPPSLKLRRVKATRDLGKLDKGRAVSRQRLSEANRWSVLTRVTPKIPDGYIELGELCRVHRGAVTGANDVWIAGRDTDLPRSVLFPSVTRAHELFNAGERLVSHEILRRVIDLPADLDVFDRDERKKIDQFLHVAKHKKVDEGYIASKRKAWWRVGLRDAAPVLATYMARRPPTFVRNDASARHINIAHGLYPREPMASTLLDGLAAYLRSAVTLSQGRTYAGGLTKFEPKEMERLPVPSLEALRNGVLS
ncbi:class I SAM-dependent methyltransferase [Amycolatopsis sp.]|uniref:class I SAM-dependent methyltransferase n=1 Tax=Amycolatopsis sp. TaxID=37632 RepID=UPI002C50DCE6|nr:class I SAM-dependent methyltransferase [Amycolatopsis sp.]HVV11805.1 class I SAM-dependent methyltransferase [Amycolatopsis sp.]